MTGQAGPPAVRPDDAAVAAVWLIEQVAAHGVTADDLVTAAAVMNVISRVDLAPLLASDGAESPITDAAAQREGVHGAAVGLQGRADRWRRALSQVAEGVTGPEPPDRHAELLSLSCPYCGAAPGRPCQTRTGRTIDHFHRDRSTFPAAARRESRAQSATAPDPGGHHLQPSDEDWASAQHDLTSGNVVVLEVPHATGSTVRVKVTRTFLQAWRERRHRTPEIWEGFFAVAPHLADLPASVNPVQVSDSPTQVWAGSVPGEVSFTWGAVAGDQGPVLLTLTY